MTLFGILVCATALAAQPLPARPRERAPEVKVDRPPGRVPSKVKIIEVPPPEPQPTAPVPDDPVEAEILRMEVELEERAQRCAQDPVACARERAERRLVREGNEAWDAAVEAREQAREQAIEARARQLQAEADAARRAEAEARAKDLGGRLDAQGRFIDDELEPAAPGKAPGRKRR
jgi:type IV secretory pathway VirB10-like protein